MKEDVYDKKLVIAKFPHLEKQILAGDLKVLKLLTSEGECVAKIVRFSNLAIFRPNAKLACQILLEVLDEYSYQNIEYEQFGIVGLDIVGRRPKS